MDGLIRGLLPAALLTVGAVALADDSVSAQLSTLADGDHRSEANRARNEYRHPVETLTFFGIQPDMTMVEISPGGGGWYTEILAPFLRDKGKLYAANYDPDSEVEYYRRNAKAYRDKLEARPELYDQVEITVFDPPDKLRMAPDGTADMVLTFRNFHNWMEEGSQTYAMAAMYKVLKPGGILGIVQHRQRADNPQDPEAESGYVREDYVIEAMEALGFQLVAASEINANPKDTGDHPEGVWTLPPGFELGDVDREKYQAIGESDRMTLKFIKPE